MLQKEPIIRISNLSKQYRIGLDTTYNTLTESVTNFLKSPLGALRSLMKPYGTIWALKGIDLEVHKGEVVGIIGRNGSGKSTLLKILSRITHPTDGDVFLAGRVSSLLEVGVGFHPELSGRENVYLSGAILGMRKREIDEKFQDIVKFAEVEKFLDTPVKRYSSGMYVRLAFAVAAHMDTDILLVDEVLAVGDAAFQKKCLGKMEMAAEGGRTVLFVSHNMPAINRLCSRAVLLDGGRLVKDGPAIEVTGFYLNSVTEAGALRSWSMSTAPGTPEVKLTSVKLVKENGLPASIIEVDEPLKLNIGYYVVQPHLCFRCAALFYTQGVCAFVSIEPVEYEREAAGHYHSILSIPSNLLAEGEYTVGVSIIASRGVKFRYVQIKDAIAFQVFDSIKGSSARGDYAENLAGVVRPRLNWILSYGGADKTVKDI